MNLNTGYIIRDECRRYGLGEIGTVTLFSARLVSNVAQRNPVDEDAFEFVTLSPVGQEPKPKLDYEAMWNELFNRDDTSLALRDIMKEIKTKHTPKPEKPEGK
ncbi:MAG: hypothetical protein IMF11_20240 [Proteobacteria bacterium]|nr:hypothetical protein [Pseudomonadota bacterium]